MKVKKFLSMLIAVAISMETMGLIAFADEEDSFFEDTAITEEDNMHFPSFSEQSEDKFTFGDMSFSSDVSEWLNSVGFDYGTFSSYSFSMPEMSLSSQDLSDRYNDLMSDIVIQGYGTQFDNIDFELPQYSLDVSSLYADCWGSGLASDFQQFASFNDVWGDKLNTSYTDICTQAQKSRDALFSSASNTFSTSNLFNTFSYVQSSADYVVADFLATHGVASYSQLMNSESMKNAQEELTAKSTASYNTSVEDMQNSLTGFSIEFDARQAEMQEKYKNTNDLAKQGITDVYSDPSLTEGVDSDVVAEVESLIKQYGTATEALKHLSLEQKYGKAPNGIQYAGGNLYSEWIANNSTPLYKLLTSKAEKEAKDAENAIEPVDFESLTSGYQTVPAGSVLGGTRSFATKQPADVKQWHFTSAKQLTLP